MIDSRAVVSSDAEIHESAEIGPFAVIGAHVKIGKGTIVGASSVIDGHTIIGEDCKIFPFASVGTIPQDLKYHGEQTTLEIGDRTVVREYANLNIGTEGGGGVTRIGSDCLIMVYSHVAHDCIIGNHVILANAVTLAGHVVVDDWAIVGGITGVHQFARIGEHAFIGGASAVSLDVPPYMSAAGNRAKLFGLNLTGLKRRDFSPEALKALRRAYKMIFQTKATMKRALEEVRNSPEYGFAEVKKLVDFIAESERGVVR